MESLKDKFDLEIKKLSKISDSEFGYESKNVRDLRKKDVYFSFEAWTNFYNNLKSCYPNAYEKYSEGDGGEIEEKNGRYGWIPPKMCSIASSSRFIFLSFKDNINEKIKLFDTNIKTDGFFEFEKKLLIPQTGSTPNLDGYFKNNETAIYFEAKCHEIFDSHSLVWKNAYFTNGAFSGKERNALHLSEELFKKHFVYDKKLRDKIIDEENMELDASAFDLKTNKGLRLDIKQFVCHLLGIANDKDTIGLKRQLVYFYFKPKSLSDYKQYEMLEKEFYTFVNCKIIKEFCKNNQIEIKLFYAINNNMEDQLEVKRIY